MFGGQQVPQSIVHGVLTFVGRQLQNLHIQFVRHFFCMSGPQCVPCQTKAAGGKHFLAVSIVRKRARLAHEGIDDVPITDGRQLLADESRHGLNHMSVMRDRDLFGTDPQIHQFADQSTGNRIRVRPHADGTAATDAHTLYDVVRIQFLIRQSVQMSQIVEILLPSIGVGAFDQAFHEGDVLFSCVEVATATQQQRLINTILQVAVR